MDFEFDEDKPIYKQLVEKLKLQIILGFFKPGDKLPSVRELSSIIRVNPNTIQRSLSELEDVGLIFTKRTSGKFVTENQKIIHQIKKELAIEKTDKFINDMNELGLNKNEVIKLLRIKYALEIISEDPLDFKKIEYPL